MSAVIGDIPNAIIADFKHGRCTVFSVLPGCARLSGIAFIARVSRVAFIAGRLYAEGGPALSAVIGDIPNAIVADFKHGRYAVFAVSTVFTGGAVFSGVTVFSGGAILTVYAVLAVLSVSAGRLYAEGGPALPAVIGDIPNVIVADFKHGRCTVFSVLSGVAFITLISRVSFVALQIR